MMRSAAFLIVLLPVALQAQKPGRPRFEPPDGKQRAARVLDNIQRLDASLAAIRRLYVDTVTGTVQWVEMEPGVVARTVAMPTAEAAASRFVATYGPQLFGSKFAPADLRLIKTYSDGQLTHFRYAQLYNGIPVYGGDLVVHVARVNGRHAVQSLNGRIYPGIDAPTQPVLSFDAARQAAIGPAVSTIAIEDQDPTPLIVPDGSAYRLAYRVTVSDPTSGTVTRYVDAVSGVVFAETPAVISAIGGSATPQRTSGNAVTTDMSAPEPAMAYVATYGTDQLGQQRTFNVWQASGSLFQMASNGWPGITQIEIRNFMGADILTAGNCGSNRPYVSASNIGNGWPSTTDAGKEEVSAVANMGESHRFLNTRFGRRGIYDDVVLKGARACVHGIALDTLGNRVFDAVFYPSNYTWGFVQAEPGFRASAAAQDVVTHEVWHGVNADEAGFIFDTDPLALNEGLADYFGARHRNSSCLGADALGFCLRQLNASPTLANLRNSCATQNWPQGEPHCLSVAYSSGLWATANQFANYGDPTDWAVYNGLRYYMTSSTNFDLGRESVVRAGKDRLRANQTNVDIIYDLENAFYVRGIGREPVRVALAQGPCNAWAPGITGSGSRSFILWFEAGVGFFNDGSTDHKFYSVNLGTFTAATLAIFGSAQVGGHTVNDGHDHAFLFRFTDVSPAVGFLDYFAPSTRQCGIQPVAARDPQPGEIPTTFAVRQAVRSGSAFVSSRIAASSAAPSGSQGAETGLAAEIRASGISALEVDIPTDRAGQRLEITVFDLQGRPVRTITEDGVAAGRKTIVWDRLTATGATAPAGVYTVIVRYGSATQRTRFVIPRSHE